MKNLEASHPEAWNGVKVDLSSPKLHSKVRRRQSNGAAPKQQQLRRTYPNGKVN